ncbi:MTH865 family protein [Natrialbaceae archaeon A-CW1-1]
MTTDDFEDQLFKAYEQAMYPINSPFEFVSVLPEGSSTKFELDDDFVTAMEIHRRPELNFPYDDTESFVSDVVDIFAESEE